MVSYCYSTRALGDLSGETGRGPDPGAPQGSRVSTRAPHRCLAVARSRRTRNVHKATTGGNAIRERVERCPRLAYVAAATTARRAAAAMVVPRRLRSACRAAQPPPPRRERRCRWRVTTSLGPACRGLTPPLPPGPWARKRRTGCSARQWRGARRRARGCSRGRSRRPLRARAPRADCRGRR